MRTRSVFLTLSLAAVLVAAGVYGLMAGEKATVPAGGPCAMGADGQCTSCPGGQCVGQANCASKADCDPSQCKPSAACSPADCAGAKACGAASSGCGSI